MSDADPLARAWALKDAAYAAWSSDPARAADAAQTLRQQAAESGAPPLVHALACWAEGIAALAQADMATALERLGAAASALTACGQDRAAAQTLVPCIMALAMLGRHDESVACAAQARQRLEALGDTVGAAKVSLNLAALHIRRGEGAAAVEPARRASALFARIADHEHSVMGDVSLADALALAGDLDEALRIYARADARASRHALPVLQALVAESRALVHGVRGAWRQALQGLEAARRRYADLDLPQHLAIAEKQLADAYLELRLLPEALALADAAAQRFETLDLPDERASALLLRAQVHHLRGHDAEARADLAQAGQLFDTLGHGQGSAAVHLACAELDLALGRAEPAAALAVQALQVAGPACSARLQMQAELLQARAGVQAGRFDDAAVRLQALLQQARAQQVLPLAAACLTELGLVAQRAGDAQAARRHWDEAVALTEAQRRALPGSDFSRGFAALHQRPYQLLLALDLAEGGALVAAGVLQRLERFRARAVHAPPRAAASGPRDARRERLDWLYRRRQRLADDGRQDTALEAEARQLEHALLEADRRDRMHAAPAQTAADDAPFDVQALCAALGEGIGAGDGAGLAVVVLAFVEGELLAVVARRSGLQLVRHLARAEQVAPLCDALHNQMQTLVAGADRLAAHLPQLCTRVRTVLQRLQALLWNPLRDALGACRQVMLVPTGPLADLPWSVVATAGDPVAPAPQIVLAVSARAALASLRGSVAAAAPPTAARPPQRPAPQLLAWADTERLTHAGAEARAVQALHGHGQVLEGVQATCAAFQQHAPAATLLHLACHARFRRDNPSFSALQLADGELTVEQVAALPLQAELVVLSACNSARADTGAADDGIGLVQAFLAAGCQRVLAALWPVHDAVAAQLMQALHQALAAGATPADALAGAQRAVAAVHPHPYFWAPFVLHGHW